MKFWKVLIAILLFGSGNAGLHAATADQEHSGGKPDWEVFHVELERAVQLQVDAAKSEGEMRLRHQGQLEVQHVSVVTDDQSEGNETKHAPESLVDSSTFTWLNSALRHPIPDETSMRAIFRKEHVPEELIYVGLVESGYSKDAVSSAGAVGPWQFIDETGRRYGLKQSKKGDDRRDLMKSTRAAARYLRDLHDLFGDWKLALAGYNAGENRVLRAMQKAGTKDFWSLQYLLPQETAQYVPRVLAALSIAQRAHPVQTEGPESEKGLTQID